MDILNQLISLQNIVLCLAIVALVWVQRKSVELFSKKVLKKDLLKSDIWTEFFVPIGPLGTGLGLMFVPGVPVPEMFMNGQAKFVFGIGLGLISGLLFRILKKNLLERLGKTSEETPYLDESENK